MLRRSEGPYQAAALGRHLSWCTHKLHTPRSRCGDSFNLTRNPLQKPNTLREGIWKGTNSLDMGSIRAPGLARTSGEGINWVWVLSGRD